MTFRTERFPVTTRQCTNQEKVFDKDCLPVHSTVSLGVFCNFRSLPQTLHRSTPSSEVLVESYFS